MVLNMALLKSDLSRNFAIGFLIGAAIVGIQLSPDQLTAIPQALAATVTR